MNTLTRFTQHAWAQALLRQRVVALAIAAALLAAVYWLLIASDRYVSEARVTVQRTDLAGGQTMDLSGLLTGVASGSKADELLLRDYLLSVDMLKTLDAALDLRSHYSSWNRDPVSSLWFRDSPVEWLHRHYLSRVSVELDDYSGLLVVRVQAYDPEMAHAIASTLVSKGEGFMNDMAHRLAQSQVQFLEQQLVQMHQRSLQARQELIDFQNKKGLVSPQSTAETLVGIVSKLQAQRSELETQRTALKAYLVAEHPNIVTLNQQIAALDQQIQLEERKLAAPQGKTLNRTVEEYQRLEMQAKFAEDVYKTALVALEKGRIEATRTIKKVSMTQGPMRAEYPLEPRRLYNSFVTLLVALLIAGVVQLILAVIRDHAD